MWLLNKRVILFTMEKISELSDCSSVIFLTYKWEILQSVILSIVLMPHGNIHHSLIIQKMFLTAFRAARTLMLAVFHVVAPLPGPGLHYCAYLAPCRGLLGHRSGTEPSLKLLVTPDRSNLLL